MAVKRSRSAAMPALRWLIVASIVTLACGKRDGVFTVTFVNGTQQSLNYGVPKKLQGTSPGPVGAAEQGAGAQCCLRLQGDVSWYDSLRFSVYSSANCLPSTRVCDIPGQVQSVWVCGCPGGDCSGEHTILAQTPVLSSNDAAAAKDGGELSAITTEHMYTQHGLPTRITVFRRPGEAINADESTSGGSSSSNGSSTSSDACAIQGLKMEYVQRSALIGRPSKDQVVLGTGLKKDPVTEVVFQKQGSCLTYFRLKTRSGRSATVGSLDTALELHTATAPAGADGLAAIEGAVQQADKQQPEQQQAATAAAKAPGRLASVNLLWGVSHCSTHASGLRRAAAAAATMDSAHMATASSGEDPLWYDGVIKTTDGAALPVSALAGKLVQAASWNVASGGQAGPKWRAAASAAAQAVAGRFAWMKTAMDKAAALAGTTDLTGDGQEQQQHDGNDSNNAQVSVASVGTAVAAKTPAASGSKAPKWMPALFQLVKSADVSTTGPFSPAGIVQQDGELVLMKSAAPSKAGMRAAMMHTQGEPASRPGAQFPKKPTGIAVAATAGGVGVATPTPNKDKATGAAAAAQTPTPAAAAASTNATQPQSSHEGSDDVYNPVAAEAAAAAETASPMSRNTTHALSSGKDSEGVEDPIAAETSAAAAAEKTASPNATHAESSLEGSEDFYDPEAAEAAAAASEDQEEEDKEDEDQEGADIGLQAKAAAVEVFDADSSTTHNSDASELKASVAQSNPVEANPAGATDSASNSSTDTPALAIRTDATQSSSTSNSTSTGSSDKDTPPSSSSSSSSSGADQTPVSTASSSSSSPQQMISSSGSSRDADSKPAAEDTGSNSRTTTKTSPTDRDSSSKEQAKLDEETDEWWRPEPYTEDEKRSATVQDAHDTKDAEPAAAADNDDADAATSEDAAFTLALSRHQQSSPRRQAEEQEEQGEEEEEVKEKEVVQQVQAEGQQQADQTEGEPQLATKTRRLGPGLITNPAGNTVASPVSISSNSNSESSGDASSTSPSSTSSSEGSGDASSTSSSVGNSAVASPVSISSTSNSESGDASSSSSTAVASPVSISSISSSPNLGDASSSNTNSNSSSSNIPNSVATFAPAIAPKKNKFTPCRLADPFCFKDDECYCQLPNGTFGAACPMFGSCLGACCSTTGICPDRMGYEEPQTKKQSVLLPKTCNDWGLDEESAVVAPEGATSSSSGSSTLAGPWGAWLECKLPKERECTPGGNSAACVGYTVCKEGADCSSNARDHERVIGAMCVFPLGSSKSFDVCSCLPVY